VARGSLRAAVACCALWRITRLPHMPPRTRGADHRGCALPNNACCAYAGANVRVNARKRGERRERESTVPQRLPTFLLLSLYVSLPCYASFTALCPNLLFPCSLWKRGEEDMPQRKRMPYDVLHVLEHACPSMKEEGTCAANLPPVTQGRGEGCPWRGRGLLRRRGEGYEERGRRRRKEEDKQRLPEV